MRILKEQLQWFISNIQSTLEDLEGIQSDIVDKTEKDQQELELFHVQMKLPQWYWFRRTQIIKIARTYENTPWKNTTIWGESFIRNMWKQHNVKREQDVHIYFGKIKELSKSLDELALNHNQNHEACFDKTNKFETDFPATFEKLTGKSGAKQQDLTLYDVLLR